jgi:uncharacterized FlaG/YvyC family protein
MSTISVTAPAAQPLVIDNTAPAAATTTAENRSIAKAVRDLNAVNYAGDGREVSFSVDRASKEPVITVIDSATKEVITQWPPKYLLALASELDSHSKE